MNPHKLYVNFGFWDVVKTDHEEGYFNKAIEAKVRKLNGQKSLYSTSFYSREEFGELYNEARLPPTQDSIRSHGQTQQSL